MYCSELTLWCFPFSSSVNAFIFKDTIDFCLLCNDIDDTAVCFLCSSEGHLLRNPFYCFVNEQRTFAFLFPSPSTLFCPLQFRLSVLFSFLSLLIAHCFHSSCDTSLVWRLYPGQRGHHPVSWLSRLLPTQPELHLDNRDLPWQRWAE